MTTTESGTVLITGPTRGLGRAAVLAMADRPDGERPDLLLVGRDGKALTQAADEARARGAKVHEIGCDLSRLADVRAAARSGFSEAAELEGFKVWPALRCPGGRPNGADTKAPPLPRALSFTTERAAAHSLQFGTYALSAAGLLAALAVRPVPLCALTVPRAVND